MSRVLSLLVAALVPVALATPASASPVPTVEPPPPTTSAVATGGVRIAAAGDIACDPPYTRTATRCQHAATAAMITKRSGIAAVLALGDNQYERGTLSDFQQSYARTWGAFKHKTRPVPGNHEYLTAGASGYYSYFGAAAHRSAGGYYAYNLGQWRMYTLNTNCDRISCSAELEWLRRDLAANPRRCTLVAMHHPRFSSGVHGDSRWAGAFWPVLDARQVDVVLAGHDHDYERFAPMSAGGALSSQGIRSWVVGTGGKELRPFAGRHTGSVVRSNVRAGVLFMNLRAQDYSWRFRTVDGVLRDSGTARCVA